MPSDDDRRDTLGVAVQVGDQVRITSWGGTVRLMDVGSLVTVTGFTRYGNLRHDTEVARGAVIPVKQTAVARRDGKVGHQGNVVAPVQESRGEAVTAQSDAYERLFALVMRALLVAHDNHPNSHEQIARDLLDQMIEALEAQE